MYRDVFVLKVSLRVEVKVGVGCPQTTNQAPWVADGVDWARIIKYSRHLTLSLAPTYPLAAIFYNLFDHQPG